MLGGGGLRLAGIAPQEGDGLTTVDRHIGLEGGLGNTLGDALFHRPQHCLVVEGAFLYVGEAVLSDGGLGLTGHSPQEGDELCTGCVRRGHELCCSYAGGYAVFYGPQHCIIVEGTAVYIGEGMLGLGIGIRVDCRNLLGVGGAADGAGEGLHAVSGFSCGNGDHAAVIFMSGCGDLSTGLNGNTADGADGVAGIALLSAGGILGILHNLGMSGCGNDGAGLNGNAADGADDVASVTGLGASGILGVLHNLGMLVVVIALHGIGVAHGPVGGAIDNCLSANSVEVIAGCSQAGCLERGAVGDIGNLLPACAVIGGLVDLIDGILAAGCGPIDDCGGIAGADCGQIGYHVGNNGKVCSDLTGVSAVAGDGNGSNADLNIVAVGDGVIDTLGEDGAVSSGDRGNGTLAGAAIGCLSVRQLHGGIQLGTCLRGYGSGVGIAGGQIGGCGSVGNGCNGSDCEGILGVVIQIGRGKLGLVGGTQEMPLAVLVHINLVCNGSALGGAADGVPAQIHGVGGSAGSGQAGGSGGVDPHLQSHGTLAVKVVAAGVGIDCNGSNADILVVGPHTGVVSELAHAVGGILQGLAGGRILDGDLGQFGGAIVGAAGPSQGEVPVCNINGGMLARNLSIAGVGGHIMLVGADQRAVRLLLIVMTGELCNAAGIGEVVAGAVCHISAALGTALIGVVHNGVIDEALVVGIHKVGSIGEPAGLQCAQIQIVLVVACVVLTGNAGSKAGVLCFCGIQFCAAALADQLAGLGIVQCFVGRDNVLTLDGTDTGTGVHGVGINELRGTVSAHVIGVYRELLCVCLYGDVDAVVLVGCLGKVEIGVVHNGILSTGIHGAGDHINSALALGCHNVAVGIHIGIGGLVGLVVNGGAGLHLLGTGIGMVMAAEYKVDAGFVTGGSQNLVVAVAAAVGVGVVYGLMGYENLPGAVGLGGILNQPCSCIGQVGGCGLVNDCNVYIAVFYAVVFVLGIGETVETLRNGSAGGTVAGVDLVVAHGMNEVNARECAAVLAENLLPLGVVGAAVYEVAALNTKVDILVVLANGLQGFNGLCVVLIIAMELCVTHNHELHRVFHSLRGEGGDVAPALTVAAAADVLGAGSQTGNGNVVDVSCGVIYAAQNEVGEIGSTGNGGGVRKCCILIRCCIISSLGQILNLNVGGIGIAAADPGQLLGGRAVAGGGGEDDVVGACIGICADISIAVKAVVLVYFISNPQRVTGVVGVLTGEVRGGEHIAVPGAGDLGGTVINLQVRGIHFAAVVGGNGDVTALGTANLNACGNTVVGVYAVGNLTGGNGVGIAILGGIAYGDGNRQLVHSSQGAGDGQVKGQNGIVLGDRILQSRGCGEGAGVAVGGLVPDAAGEVLTQSLNAAGDLIIPGAVGTNGLGNQVATSIIVVAVCALGQLVAVVIVELVILQVLGYHIHLFGVVIGDVGADGCDVLQGVSLDGNLVVAAQLNALAAGNGNGGNGAVGVVHNKVVDLIGLVAEVIADLNLYGMLTVGQRQNLSLETVSGSGELCGGKNRAVQEHLGSGFVNTGIVLALRISELHIEGDVVAGKSGGLLGGQSSIICLCGDDLRCVHIVYVGAIDPANVVNVEVALALATADDGVAVTVRGAAGDVGHQDHRVAAADLNGMVGIYHSAAGINGAEIGLNIGPAGPVDAGVLQGLLCAGGFKVNVGAGPAFAVPVGNLRPEPEVGHALGGVYPHAEAGGAALRGQRIGHTIVGVAVLGAAGGREVPIVVGQLQCMLAKPNLAGAGIDNLTALTMEGAIDITGVCTGVPNVHIIAVRCQNCGCGTDIGVVLVTVPTGLLGIDEPFILIAVFVSEAHPGLSVGAIGFFLGALIFLAVVGYSDGAVLILGPGLLGLIDLVDPVRVAGLRNRLEVVQGVVMLKGIGLVLLCIVERVRGCTPVPQANHVFALNAGGVLKVHCDDGHLADLYEDRSGDFGAVLLGVGNGDVAVHGEALLGAAGEDVAGYGTEVLHVNAGGVAAYVPGKVAVFMIQGHACASDGQAQIGRIIEVQADAGAAEGNLLGLYQLNGGLAYDLILIHQLYAYGTQLSGSCGKQTGGSVDGTHLSAVLIEGPGQAGLR